MTQAQVSISRAVRATGILASGGLVELASGQGFVAVDVVSGSGKAHLTTVDSCDCADRVFKGNICKHMISARLASGIECCASCGSRTRYEIHYVGGRGDCGFMVCLKDRTHKAKRVD